MDTQTLSLSHSPFVSVAIGFFGLATGYFVSGRPALTGFPKSAPGDDGVLVALRASDGDNQFRRATITRSPTTSGCHRSSCFDAR